MIRVRIDKADGVMTITLCEPPANTYSYEMMRELDAAVLEARMDPDVHVVVLTGDGDRFFCAGADIKTLTSVTTDYKYMFCLHANETLLRLENTPKLIIAAIAGHCVGGGLEVAMACDLRIARKGSGKCGLPEVKLGVLPGTGGTQRLVRIVGRSSAIKLMAEAELFDFDRALALGLVDEVVDLDPAAFRQHIQTYAQRFTAPNAAPKAIGFIKRAVVSGADMGLEQGLALERELQQRLFCGEDAKEGMAANLEKRPAKFKGL